MTGNGWRGKLMMGHFRAWCEGWSTASPALFMSAHNFLECHPERRAQTGCWSEESKEPYGRQQFQICCCARRPHCDFLQL